MTCTVSANAAMERNAIFHHNVFTPRTFYGIGKCGAWSFVHRVPITLEKHVRRTKTTKHAFSLQRKDEHVT